MKLRYQKQKVKERRPRKIPIEGSRATTTPLVAHFFESVFGTEMEKGSCTKSTKGCGQCPPCQAIDCGSCDHCLKMKKFSGDTNDRLLICDRRQCDNSEETKRVLSHELSPRKREKYTKISLLPEDKVEVKSDTSYYRRVQINDDFYQIGDFAEVYPGQFEFAF